MSATMLEVPMGVSAESLVLPDVPPRPFDLPEADLSTNARTVLAKRYLKKDESGNPVEDPEEMFWRVAFWIAREDMRYGATLDEVMQSARTFYGIMVRRQWLPNSPTLMNAGRPLGQLSACFVLPVEDALSNGRNGIYDTLTAMARVHQSGGGTGFSFSRLRPAGDIVKSTTGVASGPVSFMKLYDASTEVVKQGGTRRGANMGILRVDHPDILEFIDCKTDLTQVTNFNISVAVTDAFMQALEAGQDYDLIDPRKGEVVGSLSAAMVFDRIIKNAWQSGEPGIFFVDRANHFNPVPHLGSYEATNPCGEQPLLPYDVCNLGSINLGVFVKEGVDSHSWEDRFDFDAAREVIRAGVHFLDNVIDANQYPLPEVHDLAHRIRRIGNGVMGLADALVRLGVQYDSPEGLAVAYELAKFFAEASYEASEELAKTRGTFSEWERSIWGPDETCARDAEGNRIREYRLLRNCNVTTCAPTGTISIIAGCSSGIEPLFAVAFMRNQAGVMMPDVNEDFVAALRSHGVSEDRVDALVRQVAEAGNIHFAEVPESVQSVFRTAHDISPEYHVRMQAAWQQWIDSAISKTTNFPYDATEQDVRQIYELAFSLGCKGVTVYRDGSRDAAPLTTGATKKAQAAPDAADRIASLEAENTRLQKQVEAMQAAQSKPGTSRKRPAVLKGTTRKKASPVGDVYVTINEDEKGQPFEVFATLGKAGGVLAADTEGIGRLASLALRSGVPVREVIKQLRGISSDRAIGFGANKVLSLPDAIAQALDEREQEKAGVQTELLPELEAPASEDGTALYLTCPDCSSQVEVAEGCMKCHICGYSECG